MISLETSDILVVDDMQENLSILTWLLTRSGYHVRSVLSGELALKAVQEAVPDLILLDIVLPGIDGFEVCRQLKASEKTKDVPIIFLSALDDTAEKVKAFEIGGVDYQTKPFHAEEVRVRVATHLMLRKMYKTLQEKNLQLQEALDKVKTLKGLLPICAQCKKIRDDQGYWKQLEHYIEQHSDALFTHGLCPDCLQKLYDEEQSG